MESLAFLEAMRERYGDVFPVRLGGGESLLVVGDPELVERVFLAPGDVLHAGEANRRGLGWLFGENSLALLDERRHLEHRRLLLPALHGERIERQAASLRAMIDAQVATWPLGEEIAMLPALRELTLDLAIWMAFGEGDRERLASLQHALLGLHSAETVEGGDEASRRLIAEAEELVDAEVRHRREGSSGAGGDVLALLLEARLEDGSPLSDAEIRDELVTLLAAGYETTATALGWLLERLARNPAALAAVEREAGEDDGPYTEAAIRETLRMRPPVPMSARLVKQPFELGPRSLAPGTVIALSALLIHHRADLYPEPLVFRPERFLERQPGTYTWIPFGGGMRRCIGAGLALREIRAVLAALLSRATLRPLSAEPEEMRSGRNTIGPARGAEVVLEPRRRPSRLPNPWSDAAAWAGDGLRREVFFFRSGEVDLYGSLFAAVEPTRPYGVVACQSWGTDADRSDPLLRSVALSMARLGGAGMVFHYPGFGDSFGDLGALTMADLRDAAGDAAAEAARRCPGLTWIFAGFMFGASVACLAQQRANPAPLLLVQPTLRPGAYFKWLTQTSEPLAPGPSPRQMMEVGTAPGMTYGYAIPRHILERAVEADEAVASALLAVESGGALVHHANPEQSEPAPDGFERVEVPGTWRFGSQNHPALIRATAEWLDRSTREVNRWSLTITRS